MLFWEIFVFGGVVLDDESNKEAEYAFYRGDNVIFVGTLSECAEYFDTDRSVIQWYGSPSARLRALDGVDTRRIYAIRVDWSSDDEC